MIGFETYAKWNHFNMYYCEYFIDRATNMNEHSSRSHAIFVIYIECSEVSMMELSLW